jgi:hypothetical protein
LLKEEKMNINLSILRKLIKENLLKEVEIEELEDVCLTSGSTHVMQTCKLDGKKWFLKFSDEWLFDDFDPSLQILIEYLSYKIYNLYPSIRTPDVRLVWDRKSKKVGIATTPAPGKQASAYNIDVKRVAKQMSAGVYVDIFLANWDVIGTDNYNFFVDDETDTATRIDPGGSLTFRAQGGRKNSNFSKKAGELSTMLSPSSGAGAVYQWSDLSVAAKEFLSVGWDKINNQISLVDKEIKSELQKSPDMSGLASEWQSDVELIRETLEERWKEIKLQATEILKNK